MPLRGIGWKYNLPSSKALIQTGSTPTNIYHTPNHIDDNFIEIPRSPLKLRGYWLVISPIFFTLAIILYFTYPAKATTNNFEYATTDLFIFLIGAILVAPYIRMELECPRDQPIRFNRHRRKVYFYQYRFDQLQPFGRKKWGIKPVVYDWDDLTAEAYRLYLPLGYGGLKEWVMLSVRKPGTDEVIDRVFFTDDINKGEQYWDVVRLFMHQGPEALPNFVDSPRDFDESPNPGACENAVHRNTFDRFAPKVKWPAAMDLESRTAPSPGEQS
ncbi:DUF6708 domain-containing protein [Pseudomonas sp. NPDC090233]|uniref:DUF6708 domain-containing protein n=1 Tax=Pseudomonas sp. NPDC090233 TaxID=3364479 RepID=UPI003839D0DF